MGPGCGYAGSAGGGSDGCGGCGVRPFKAQLSAAASGLSTATRLLSGIGVSLSAHGGRVMEIPEANQDPIPGFCDFHQLSHIPQVIVFFKS